MTGGEIGSAVQLACLLEASASKPGNVTPGRRFRDMSYEDFLASAAAIGPAFTRAGERGLGATILEAIEATRRWTRANTNLGIILLAAPLARAAALGGDQGRQPTYSDLGRQAHSRCAGAAIGPAWPL